MRRSWMMIILVLVLFAACSADTESITPIEGQAAGAAPIEEQAAVADESSTDEAGFSILGSLQLIPSSAAEDAESVLQISIADIEAAAEQAGLSRPTNTSDRDQLVEFFGPLTGLQRDETPLRMFVAMPQMLSERGIGDVDQFIDELGFSIGDIDSFVALESPPAQFVVASGVSVADGLTEVVPGVRTSGVGEDFDVNVEDRTAARPLGRPLRIAEQDGNVALSLATAPVIDWLTGTSAGTLADDPVLSALAQRLDEEQAVSAVLVTNDGAYGGVGLGWSADQQGAHGVLVFAYDSAGSAEAQLSAIEASFSGDSLTLQQPIEALLTLESIEVRGAEIVATLRFPDGRQPSTTWNMMLQRDGPFAVQ